MRFIIRKTYKIREQYAIRRIWVNHDLVINSSNHFARDTKINLL